MVYNELKRIIRETYGVDSFHVADVPVVKRLADLTIWAVVVKIFELIAHPSASRVYVWERDPKDDPGNPNRIAMVLHDGRAVWSAESAVKIGRKEGKC